MIQELSIKNYKSILDHTIELGRINVFIGENGCGKTNILEAVAMAGAALTHKLSVEELFNRGIRVAKPSITRSSFAGSTSKDIVIRCAMNTNPDIPIELRISTKSNAADAAWVVENDKPKDMIATLGGVEEAQRKVALAMNSPSKGRHFQIPANTLSNTDISALNFLIPLAAQRALLAISIDDFVIYNVSIQALRGLQVTSRRTPLGIYGETLDYAISALKPKVWADLLKRAKCISWLENIVVDPADQLKYQGHKLGGSQSSLYFHDKHMNRKNNVFSAENVNEGVLHILFHLTLFASADTPKLLGIDNIETALNPQLCRDLMKQLAELAVKHDKQALITTHNPAILDGLNLHDDEQRLFVVSRNDEGHTVTRRIKLKPEGKGPQGEKLKLSELWMRGALGGIPQKF